MPVPFEKCVKDGGKIRRISGANKEHGLKKGESVELCALDGKTYKGYKKKKVSHYRKD